MNITDFLGRLDGVRKTPSGWQARCPAHEDTKPSLSISTGDDGRILIHCQTRECSPEAIVGKLGLRMSDLMPSDNGNGRAGEIIATYDYHNAAGELVSQAVRKHPKDFFQRRPDGNGGWVNKLGDAERVPYRLPELLAADPKAIVWIPEGEKDVGRLAALGLVATCNAMGAGKWRREHGEHFSGRRVVVLPDNDSPGRKHGQQVAASLQGVAASVKVLVLPGLADKQDVSDWLDSGGTVGELIRLANACQEWVAGQQAPDETPALDPDKYTTGTPEIVMASTLTRKEVSWLWPGRIPLGKLTLLVGDPGLGKSLLTLDLASVVSTGLTWPDGSAGVTPSGVVLLSAEDGLEDTIVPRLDAAGANRERIGILKGVRWYDPDTKQETVDMFSLKRDISRLEKAIDTVPKTLLVIVDPISAYLGSTDSHNNSEVRAVLGPLAELAEKTGVALVAVDHLNKSKAGPAIYRSMGSIGFVGAARAVWGIVKDKQDPATRLMVPIKCNLSPDTTGMSYTVMESPDFPNVPIIAWSRNVVKMTADEVMSGEREKDADQHCDVDAWLSEMLADGKMSVKDLQRVARDSGHHWRTVERSKGRLGVTSSREGFGPGAVWFWGLSDDS